MKRALIWVAAAIGLVAVAWLGWDLYGFEEGQATRDVQAEAALALASGAPTLATRGPDAEAVQAAAAAAEAQRLAEAAAKSASEGPAAGSVRVAGRVVDESRRPVAGARVVGCTTCGRSDEVATDADGRFEVDVAVPAASQGWRALFLWAAAGTKTAYTFVGLGISGQEVSRVDAPTLVLVEGQPLDVLAVRAAQPVPGARVLLLVHGMVLLEGTTNELGRWHVPILPAGSWSVLVQGQQPGQGRAGKGIAIPRKDVDEPLEIDIGEEFQLEVSVRDKQSGLPIVGAEVFVGDQFTPAPPQGSGYLPKPPPAITDETGVAIVTRLGEGLPITVTAAAKGYPPATPWQHVNMTVAAKGARSVKLELEGHRTVRFPIGKGEETQPSEGAVLTAELTRMWGWFSGNNEPLVARVERGDVVVEGLPPSWASGTIRTADGLLANFHAQPKTEKGSPVVFERGMGLVVRVVDGEGKPVPRVILLMADRTNNNVFTPPVETDKEGLATFAQVGYKSAMLRRLESAQSNWWQAPVVAQPDLDKIEGVYEVKLAAIGRVVLDVRLSGVAKLPAQFTLLVGNVAVPAAGIAEDPEAATIAFDLPPVSGEPAVRKIVLHASGHLPGEVELAVDQQSGEIRRQVDLLASASLVCHLVPSEDGVKNLQLERFNPQTNVWSAYQARGQGGLRDAAAPPPDPLVVNFEGLDDGMYRVVDQMSESRSDAVDVRIGAEPSIVLLDLSASVWTIGRVVAPRGTVLNAAQVRIVRGGVDPLAAAWGGQNPDDQGRFQLRSVRGRAVELVVWHPNLMPAAVGGRVRVRGGDQDVVLRLSAGAGVSFRLAGLAPSPHGEFISSRLHRSDEASVSVSFWQGGFDGPLAKQVYISSQQGRFRAGGLVPGTYAMQVLSDGRAPLLLPAVELSEGERDLGLLRLPEGASLQVFALRAEGAPSAHLQIHCERLGVADRHCHGYGEAKAGTPIAVRGLEAGRWKVRIYKQDTVTWGAQTLLSEQELDVDGQSESRLEVPIP